MVYENTDDDDAVELEDLDDFAEEEELDVDFLLEELLSWESEELSFEFSDEDDSVSEVPFSGDEVEPSPLQANNAIAMVAMIGLIRNFFMVSSFSSNLVTHVAVVESFQVVLCFF